MRHDFHSTLSPIAGDAAWMERTGDLPGPADAAEAQFFPVKPDDSNTRAAGGATAFVPPLSRGSPAQCRWQLSPENNK